MPSLQHRGVSLVELLVGLALGLFIVAIATSLLVARLQSHRELLLQSRLMQDLRVAADIVARDLRRAGYWGEAGAASATRANPYTALTVDAPGSESIGFRYSRDEHEDHGVDANEQFGFRLHEGVIEMLLGGRWQALTDSTTMTVTAFSITPELQEITLEGFCATPCPPASTDCPPHQLVRSLAVSISGRAATAAALVRTVRSHVRLRNDPVVGHCAH
jgi:type IV pilus assembly protein PilW